MGQPTHTVNYSAKMVTGSSISAGQVLISSGTEFVVATTANRASYGRSDGIAITSSTSGGSVVMVTVGRVDASITGLAAGSVSWVRVSATGTVERVTSPSGTDDVIGWAEANGDVHFSFGVVTTAVATLASLGTPLQVLRTNAGATAVEWATISFSPAGSSGQVQWNNAGAFGGASVLTTDGTTYLGIGTVANLPTTGDLRIASTGTVYGKSTSSIPLLAVAAGDEALVGTTSALGGGAQASAIRLYSTAGGFIYFGYGSSTTAYMSSSGLTLYSRPLIMSVSNPATTGDQRFASAQSVRFRDNGNANDKVAFETDANDYLYVGTSAAFGNNFPRVYLNPSSVLQARVAGAVAIYADASFIEIDKPLLAYNSPYALNGIGVQAMADANQTVGVGVYQMHAVKTTGALTARRTATMPATTDNTAYIKPWDNQCTGAFSVGVTVGSGSSVDVANGMRDLLLFDSRGVAKIASGANPDEFGLRLTLTSGTPVTTSDVATATTIYLTPYTSGRLALFYDGCWQNFDTEEISFALGTLTSGKNYDLFAYWSGSAVVLEALVWTNDTTRATALVRKNGVLVKSGDNTRRYVGTFRTISTTQTTDTATQRFLWNQYNRVNRPMLKADTTASWTQSSTTWRQANSAAGNKVEFLCGDVAEVKAHARAMAGQATNAGHVRTGIGLDSTTADSAAAGGGLIAIGAYRECNAHYDDLIAVGYHYLAWLEQGEAATTTWYGDGTNSTRNARITAVMRG